MGCREKEREKYRLGKRERVRKRASERASEQEQAKEGGREGGCVGGREGGRAERAGGRECKEQSEGRKKRGWNAVSKHQVDETTRGLRPSKPANHTGRPWPASTAWNSAKPLAETAPVPQTGSRYDPVPPLETAPLLIAESCF